MSEATTCGFEGYAIIGLIVGSVLASIGYSFKKDKKQIIAEKLQNN